MKLQSLLIGIVSVLSVGSSAMAQSVEDVREAVIRNRPNQATLIQQAIVQKQQADQKLREEQAIKAQIEWDKAQAEAVALNAQRQRIERHESAKRQAAFEKELIERQRAEQAEYDRDPDAYVRKMRYAEYIRARNELRRLSRMRR